MKSVRFFVRGRVQGVFFRGYAREQALELGLAGYARNLSDGRVEVLAQGGDEALAMFAARLARGPLLARVDGVETALEEHEPQLADFRIVR